MANLSKKEFTQDLSKLVSFETITSNAEQNKKAIDFIVSKINSKAIVKRIINNESEILIASNTDKNNPDVCFLVHVDVVAGRPDQFSMKVKNNVAYGRGVSDMKFSIPIGYSLLNEMIEQESKLSFSLIVTSDEETGGFNGAQFLSKKYGLKPKILIVPDGGDDLIFVNKSKGVCQLQITSCGRPAHSSRIWEGRNAVEPIIKLCNEILKKYGKNNKKETWNTTFNISKISGGISTNQVCDKAEASFDFRFPENTSYKEIKNEVSVIAKEISSDLSVKLLSYGNPTFVEEKNETVALFVKTFGESFKKQIKITGTHGASDARHFTSFNIPILMIKPMGGDIHGENENINIDSCITYYSALKSFMQKLEYLEN